MQRLARGEEVGPSRVYFRSSPRISAPPGPWEWLDSCVLVATGERKPTLVRLRVYVVE